jgi:signal transduction histidine kinase
MQEPRTMSSPQAKPGDAFALTDWKALLARPLPENCRFHDVQFYESAQFLAEAVAHYAGAGLAQGDAVLIVAKPAHQAAILELLEAQGHDVRKCGSRLTLLDAEATLATFMRDGVPDWDAFIANVGAVVEVLRERYGRLRAYGEMVDVLRDQGNLRGMVELERHWCRLAERQAFGLLCGYLLKGFLEESHAGAFAEVCRAHEHVLPADLPAPGAELDPGRVITLLQRRTAALEAEIAARRRAEGALRDAIRAREEFMAVASHELKTPLTSLKLHGQLMRKRLDRMAPGSPGPGELEQLARQIDSGNRQVDRLEGLVNQLLDVSRIAHGRLGMQPEEMDLADLARDVLGRYAEQLRTRGCDFRLEAPGPVRGRWDSYRIEQVISNLLSNAMKYAAGSPISVTVAQRGAQAELRVEDGGPGVGEADRRRIFERFERAVGPGGATGFGLGLYISRQIVEAHGGRIHAEGGPAGGATFVVTLPR